MIQAMKKATILFTDSKRQETLEELRSLGIAHVIQEGNETLGQSSPLNAQLSEVTEALNTITAIKTKHRRDAQNFVLQSALDYARRINAIVEQRKELEHRLRGIIDDETELLPWGDFEAQEIEDLIAQGLRIQLYAIPYKKFRREDFHHYVILSRKKSLLRILAVELIPGSFPTAFDPVELPRTSLSRLAEEKQNLLAEDRKLEQELLDLARHRDYLLAAQTYLSEERDLYQVQEQLAGDGELCWLEAYAPEKSIGRLRETARREHWGLRVCDPDEESCPPTLIQTPKLFRLVQPIFNMFGTLPGYREFDISGWFLLFFTAFFALIVSDAGYATVFFLLSLVLMLRSLVKTRIIPQLLILLSLLAFAALVWGALTASYFGSYLSEVFPILDRLVHPALSVWNRDSAKFIQLLSIIIGTVHIGIAHLWRFFRLLQGRHKLAAFAELGWLASLAGLFYIILPIVIDPKQYPLPDYALPLIFVGLAFVVLFAEQSGSFFRGVGKGLLNIFNTAFSNISLFSDIISYIRLYAVGLATFAVARSFNQIAADVASGEGIIFVLLSGLILVLGHGLNIAMCALSVIVHGIRLNMLEFSGHLGVEWNGYPYAPLQKSIEEGEKV